MNQKIQVAEGNTDGKNSLVLCDRGLMDCSAYIPQDMFLAMLKDVGISSVFEVCPSFSILFPILF